MGCYKLEFYFALMFLSITSIYGHGFCRTSSDCFDGECCVTYYLDNGIGICRPLSEEGEPCGVFLNSGPGDSAAFLNRCPCEQGLHCIAYSELLLFSPKILIDPRCIRITHPTKHWHEVDSTEDQFPEDDENIDDENDDADFEDDEDDENDDADFEDDEDDKNDSIFDSTTGSVENISTTNVETTSSVVDTSEGDKVSKDDNDAATSTTGPVESASISTDSTTGPVESASISTDSTTGPVESASISTESTTGPVESVWISNDSTTGPVESTPISSVGPTESTIGPVESASISTDNTTGPVESASISTDNTTGPVEDDIYSISSVEPTEGTTVVLDYIPASTEEPTTTSA